MPTMHAGEAFSACVIGKATDVTADMTPAGASKAAAMTSAHCHPASVAAPTATTPRKRTGADGRGADREGRNDDSDAFQCKFPHELYLSIERGSGAAASFEYGASSAVKFGGYCPNFCLIAAIRSRPTKKVGLVKNRSFAARAAKCLALQRTIWRCVNPSGDT